MKSKKIVAIGLIALTTLSLAGCGSKMHSGYTKSPTHTKVVNHYHKGTNNSSKYLRKDINYKLPSETHNYPKQLYKTDKIIVSIPKQRAYIKRNGKIIYTMYCSTGSHNRTPRGHYHINYYRANWFYAPSEHEGARYATGWHENGVYLFHATPSYKNKAINKKVAQDLGKKPSSHGCVHLTLPDAHWLELHAKEGMPVIIK